MKTTYPELQQWFSERLGSNTWNGLNYGKASQNQIMFVRDSIIKTLHGTWAFPPYEGENIFNESNEERALRKPKFLVVGSHRSKSCELPVYYLKLGEAVGDQPIEIVMRDNFHDWNVSVRSAVPLKGVFTVLISKNTSYCFYQGFPSEFIFEAYSEENNKEFSFYLNTDQELWTFFWLLFHDALKSKPEKSLDEFYV